jgi:hypothetical protein
MAAERRLASLVLRLPFSAYAASKGFHGALTTGSIAITLGSGRVLRAACSLFMAHRAS